MNISGESLVPKPSDKVEKTEYAAAKNTARTIKVANPINRALSLITFSLMLNNCINIETRYPKINSYKL